MTMGKQLDEEIMKYVPKSKIEAIQEAFEDEDGKWIWLKDGWEASRMDSHCHVIHEDTVAQLRYQIAGIKREEDGIHFNARDLAHARFENWKY